MDAEQRVNLQQAANALKSGMFVHIHGYVNSYREKANITVHADASYSSVHERSLTRLNEIVSDPGLTVEIVRNYWRDSTGKQHTRKAKNRTFVTGTKETVPLADVDFQEAIGKLRESITNPKEIDHGYDKVAPSTYDNMNTGKTYFRNVLIASKQVITPGQYPVTCSSRVNLIRNILQGMLPIAEYRTYTLEEGKFEYISLMHEMISSSSSSTP